MSLGPQAPFNQYENEDDGKPQAMMGQVVVTKEN